MSGTAPIKRALECDLVMKGGVTSGIIYPAAIAAIAQDYRLRCIGGTSAGAIGAAAAAAMEFGRRSGRNPTAPAQMANLAQKLGEPFDGKPLLLRLFEPDRATARLFRLLMRMADAKAGGPSALLRAFLLGPACLAIFLMAALVAAISWLSSDPTGASSILAGALLFLFGVPLLTSLLSAAYWVPRFKRDLAGTADNGFGFCSGMAQYVIPGPRWRWPWQSQALPVAAPSLDGWLHDQFQALAGLADGEVLTFGDLWAAAYRTRTVTREAAFAAAVDEAGQSAAAGLASDTAAPPESGQGEAAAPSPAERLIPSLAFVPRDIELALVASDINRAQSVQLPFMRREDRIYARLSDLAALFPDTVVRWMIDHQRKSAEIDAELASLKPDEAARADFIRLPFPEDLPVLFGVRMSLSFPFLFKAVRLYFVRRNAAAPDKQELAEIWLADGGITSNFPIHLFDTPIPSRPTFCLNLLYHDDELEPDAGSAKKIRPTEGDSAGETLDGSAAVQTDEDSGLPIAPSADPTVKADDLVYMLRSNHGRLSAYTRFTEGAALRRLARFGGRIVTTARQWGDNQLIDVPGYRDRIVHIRMLTDEGGFNFDMDDTKIGRLQARGTRAGSVIATRFHPDTTQDPLHPGERLTLNWANHRFVRFRSFLSGLEVAASRFASSWALDKQHAEYPSDDPRHVAPSLEQITDEVRASTNTFAHKVGYPFRNNQQADLAQDMAKVLGDLHTLADHPAWRGIDFVNGRGSSPRPKSVLKLRPPSDSDGFAERP